MKIAREKVWEDKEGNLVPDGDISAAILVAAASQEVQESAIEEYPNKSDFFSDPLPVAIEDQNPLPDPLLEKNLANTVSKLSGPGVAQLRSKLGGQFGIRLQSTGSTPDAALTRIIFQTIGVSPSNPCLVKFEQIILDSFTGTDVSATGVLTSDNTNVSNNDTVTVGNKLYTFKTTLTPTEGEVLRGGSADASLLNLIRAINHTGTPNTDYKCASANSDVIAASSVTAHAFQVTAILPGISTVATTETSAHLSWGAVTLVGGSRAGQFDLVERDSRRRVFDGSSAGGTAVLTSATMNFQSSDEGKFIKVGINPGRYYLILSRQSSTQVTLYNNIILPSAGLTLTMDGSDESAATIATKDGFTNGDTANGRSRIPKLLTVDKTYSVVFVPGTAGDAIYSISVRGLNGGK